MNDQQIGWWIHNWGERYVNADEAGQAELIATIKTIVDLKALAAQFKADQVANLQTQKTELEDNLASVTAEIAKLS